MKSFEPYDFLAFHGGNLLPSIISCYYLLLDCRFGIPSRTSNGYSCWLRHGNDGNVGEKTAPRRSVVQLPGQSRISASLVIRATMLHLAFQYEINCVGHEFSGFLYTFNDGAAIDVLYDILRSKICFQCFEAEPGKLRYIQRYIYRPAHLQAINVGEFQHCVVACS